VKAILVDDEPLALDFLERQIKKIDSVNVVKKFTHLDVSKVSNLLEEIDLVFLDIEMPEVNGLELAEQIMEVNSSLDIVFVTAFNSYAVQAFELNALDYILKPVQVERLEKTIERVKNRFHSHNNKPLTVKNRLRINICRELTIQSPQGKIEHIQWRTTKAQELFLYLLLHIGKLIRKSELIDILWPDLDEPKAYPQLYNTVYHVRKTLHLFSYHLSLRNVSEGYMLTSKNVMIDLVEWEDRIISIPPVTIKTIDEYETTMKLYTGGYLQEYEYLWAEPERFRLERLWVKTAYQMANHYYENNNIEMAESWFVNICHMQPENEDANLSLMKIYDDLGLGMLVHHQYTQLTKALEQLNVQVSPYIKKWYHQWNQIK